MLHKENKTKAKILLIHQFMAIRVNTCWLCTGYLTHISCTKHLSNY